MRQARFEVRQSTDASGVVVSVSGELDMRSVEDLTRVLGEFLGTGVDELTLDLHEVAFMDSTALKLLIDLSGRAEAESWRLRLVAPKRDAATLVLRVTGADKLLPFEAPPVD